MTKFLIALLLTISIHSCKKDPAPKNEAPAKGHFTIDEKKDPLYYVSGAQRPFKLLAYNSNNNNAQGSSTFIIQFFRDPQPGAYFVLDYNDMSNLFYTDGFGHVKLEMEQKTYRNYRQSVKKLHIIDSASKKYARVNELWLYNESDRDDSIMLSGIMAYDSTGTASWKVNDVNYHSDKGVLQFSNHYSWKFITANLEIALALPFKPTENSTIRINELYSYKHAFIYLRSLSGRTTNSPIYWLKELDTNTTANLQVVGNDVNLVIKNKIFVRGEVDPNNYSNIKHTDTQDVSTEILLDKW